MEKRKNIIDRNISTKFDFTLNGDLRFTSFSLRTRWHVFRWWNHTCLRGISISYYEHSIHTRTSVPLKMTVHVPNTCKSKLIEYYFIYCCFKLNANFTIREYVQRVRKNYQDYSQQISLQAIHSQEDKRY